MLFDKKEMSFTTKLFHQNDKLVSQAFVTTYVHLILQLN